MLKIKDTKYTNTFLKWSGNLSMFYYFKNYYFLLKNHRPKLFL